MPSWTCCASSPRLWPPGGRPELKSSTAGLTHPCCACVSINGMSVRICNRLRWASAGNRSKQMLSCKHAGTLPSDPGRSGIWLSCRTMYCLASISSALACHMPSGHCQLCWSRQACSHWHVLKGDMECAGCSLGRAPGRRKRVQRGA